MRGEFFNKEVFLNVSMNTKQHFIHSLNIVIFRIGFMLHKKIIAQMDKTNPTFLVALDNSYRYNGSTFLQKVKHAN